VIESIRRTAKKASMHKTWQSMAFIYNMGMGEGEKVYMSVQRVHMEWERCMRLERDTRRFIRIYLSIDSGLGGNSRTNVGIAEHRKHSITCE
jgi:hypothetical protein